MLSTLTVTSTSDTGTPGDGSLRGEIAAARSGDSIVFDPSLSGQTISLLGDDLHSELVINKNLTIQGPSAPLLPVTINAWGQSRVFEVDGANTVASLSNLNVNSGSGVAANPVSGGALNGQGGAIWNGGTLTLSGCELSINRAVTGGGIANFGTLTINACNLSNNTVDLGAGVGSGGAIYNAGTLTVSNSTLNNNSAGQQTFFEIDGGNGGAIYNNGTLTVSNSTLDDNSALRSEFGGGYGGGIFNAYRATATITGSGFSGNRAVGNGSFDGGGGLYNDGVMTLSGSSVTGNSDGIFNDRKGHLSIQSRSIVVNNSSYDLLNTGSVKISSDSDVGVIVK